jgi:hypothetical protein
MLAAGIEVLLHSLATSPEVQEGHYNDRRIVSNFLAVGDLAKAIRVMILYTVDAGTTFEPFLWCNITRVRVRVRERAAG